MITALDYLAKKAGSLSKPAGYFSAMVAAYERGEPIANGKLRPGAVSRPGSPVPFRASSRGRPVSGVGPI